MKDFKSRMCLVTLLGAVLPSIGIASCPIKKSDVRKGVVIHYEQPQSRRIISSDGGLIVEDFFSGEQKDEFWRLVSHHGFIPVYIGQFVNGVEVQEAVTRFEIVSEVPSIDQISATETLNIPVRQTAEGRTTTNTIEINYLGHAINIIGDCEYQTIEVATGLDFPDLTEYTNYSYVPQLNLSVTKQFMLAFKESERLRVGAYTPVSMSVLE